MCPSRSTSSTSTTSWPSPSRPRNPQQVTSPPPDEPRRARYVVIGAAGQLGFDLVRTFDRPGEVVALTRRELDVLDAGRVRAVLADLRPTCVVNTAAYNRVDQAEDDRESAFALNARAVEALAATCQALGATFVHFSTDYVFDGRRSAPYRESDAANPLNVYGESKLEGERLALARCERGVIFRVAGLFGLPKSSGKGGPNSAETMLRQAGLRAHAGQHVYVASRTARVLERLPVGARLRRGEEVTPRRARDEERVHREQHDREDALPEPREGQERRAPAGRVVVEERRVE